MVGLVVGGKGVFFFFLEFLLSGYSVSVEVNFSGLKCGLMKWFFVSGVVVVLFLGIYLIFFNNIFGFFLDFIGLELYLFFVISRFVFVIVV